MPNKRLLTLEEPLREGMVIEHLDGTRLPVKRNWENRYRNYWRLPVGIHGEWEFYINAEQVEAGLWYVYTH